MNDDSLKISFPVQGWRQFLSARDEMLAAYDGARAKAKAHEVETYHGKVAEAEVRRWLSDFLPKRFAVTSGYIISQGFSSKQKAPHFDVIIYDALNSPVLWVEDNADSSKAGRSMAIPAEHVLGVLEVKAAMSAKTMAKAIEHLNDLAPLLRGVDESSERYKLYLPRSFFCGVFFFELRESEQHDEAALKNMLASLGLRGFIGGVVLRGEGHTKATTGKLSITRSDQPIESTAKGPKRSLLDQLLMSGTNRAAENVHFGAMIHWMEPHFSQFAFDLLATLQGTYENGRLSSFHGMGTTEWDS